MLMKGKWENNNHLYLKLILSYQCEQPPSFLY